MQSEKPREAKKTQENKIFAQPVPQQGLFMATKKRDDQSVAAKLSDEAAEGVDSGVYSEFLHQLVENVSAIYDPAQNALRGCAPVMDVVYHNGHVEDVEPRQAAARTPTGCSRKLSVIRSNRRCRLPSQTRRSR